MMSSSANILAENPQFCPEILWMIIFFVGVDHRDFRDFSWLVVEDDGRGLNFFFLGFGFGLWFLFFDRAGFGGLLDWSWFLFLFLFFLRLIEHGLRLWQTDQTCHVIRKV